MNKAHMEGIWNGKLVSAIKKNVFKGKTYEMTMSVYRKIPVAEYTESGFFPNQSYAEHALMPRLRERLDYDHPKQADLVRSFSSVREVG